MEKKTKMCSKCSRDIDNVSDKCPFCGFVISDDHVPVNVNQMDYFASLHSHMKGKAGGKLTAIGKAGIILGLFMIIVSILQIFLSKGPSVHPEEIFAFMLIGTGFAIASYLWARRS